jgi:hypothetical protein
MFQPGCASTQVSRPHSQGSGIIDSCNSRAWPDKSPHTTSQSACQHQFLVNLWTGILGDKLIGPHILLQKVTQRRCFWNSTNVVYVSQCSTLFHHQSQENTLTIPLLNKRYVMAEQIQDSSTQTI